MKLLDGFDEFPLHALVVQRVPHVGQRQSVRALQHCAPCARHCHPFGSEQTSVQRLLHGVLHSRVLVCIGVGAFHDAFQHTDQHDVVVITLVHQGHDVRFSIHELYTERKQRGVVGGLKVQQTAVHLRVARDVGLAKNVFEFKQRQALHEQAVLCFGHVNHLLDPCLVRLGGGFGLYLLGVE